MGSQEVKRIDLTEFRDFGFLQEANRQFFHPLGLALEVTGEFEDEVFVVQKLGGVWDYREDPEGMLFDVSELDKNKMHRVELLRKSKVKKRKEFGCDEEGVQILE